METVANLFQIAGCLVLIAVIMRAIKEAAMQRQQEARRRQRGIEHLNRLADEPLEDVIARLTKDVEKSIAVRDQIAARKH